MRWLIAVVAFVAALLSLPSSPAALFAQCLAVLILVPTVVAPTGHRVEAAYWAMMIHPALCVVSLYVIWLADWCLLGHRPLSIDYPRITRSTQIFLDAPYAVAQLSVFYLPVLALLGCAFAVGRRPRPSLWKPLQVFPVAWMTTVVAVKWDPFEILSWFWS